ncbi:post-transcriptional regulator [Sulfoacidibacillus ferrooxidans]|uniref:Uncharacterized protein n=1 Tax=Sulfoacidibacillus ferrooxidans TaxID=2005001 RepID=A0A9X1V747_9BACL|nr:hypothetical protein [Sulfoacidibacillus ferrooxidans]
MFHSKKKEQNIAQTSMGHSENDKQGTSDSDHSPKQERAIEEGDSSTGKRRVVFGRAREQAGVASEIVEPTSQSSSQDSRSLKKQIDDAAKEVTASGEDIELPQKEHVQPLRKSVFALRAHLHAKTDVQTEEEQQVEQAIVDEIVIPAVAEDALFVVDSPLSKEMGVPPIQRTLIHPIEEEVHRMVEQLKRQASYSEAEPEDEPYNPYEHEPDEELLFLLASKVEEFHWLEYRQVTITDLWYYFCNMGKKRPQSLHDLVNAVMCLQPQAYMNFSLKSTYRAQSLDQMDLEGLI